MKVAFKEKKNIRIKLSIDEKKNFFYLFEEQQNFLLFLNYRKNTPTQQSKIKSFLIKMYRKKK